MRVVCIADTHTFEADLDVPDGDLLIHAGDMLRGGTLEELRPVASWLNSLPHAHKIIVPGNHDGCFWDHAEEARSMVDATVLEDSGITIAGVQIWGSPWQPQHPGWAYYMAPGEIASRWAMIPTGVNILATHGPARGIGDRTSSKGRVGCRDLRAALPRVRPDVHLFGHVHEEGGVWLHDKTWTANITTWECERPATVFDFHDGEVRWVQVPPTDPLALSR